MKIGNVALATTENKISLSTKITKTKIEIKIKINSFFFKSQN